MKKTLLAISILSLSGVAQAQEMEIKRKKQEVSFTQRQEIVAFLKEKKSQNFLEFAEPLLMLRNGEVWQACQPYKYRQNVKDYFKVLEITAPDKVTCEYCYVKYDAKGNEGKLTVSPRKHVLNVPTAKIEKGDTVYLRGFFKIGKSRSRLGLVTVTPE